MQGFIRKFRMLFILLKFQRKWPRGGIHGLIIGLPETVHDLEVCYCGLVEDRGAVVEMGGDEVEMRGDGGEVDVVVLPDAVLELDDCIVDHQGYSQIRFHVHRILNPDEQLAIFLLFTAELLRNQLQIQHIHLPINHKLSRVLIALIVVTIADLHLETHVLLDVVGVEVDEEALLGQELEDVILAVFGLDVLVVSHAGLQTHVPFFRGSDEGEVDPFVCKSLLLRHLHEEDRRLQVFLLELDVAVSGPLPVLIIALLRFLLVEHQHVQLIGGTNEVEAHVLLGGGFELEDQTLFLVVEEVGEGYGVLQGYEAGVGVDDGDGKLCVIECDDLDQQGVLLIGLEDSGVVVGEDLLEAVVLIHRGAFSLSGGVCDCIGSVDQQLNCILSLQFSRIVQLLSLPDLLSDRLLKRNYNCLLSVLDLLLADVETALPAFQRLHFKGTSLGFTGLLTGFKLPVIDEDVHGLDVLIPTLNQGDDAVFDLFPLIQDEVGFLPELHVLDVRSDVGRLDDEGTPDTVHDQLHPVVLLRRLLEDQAEIDVLLLVVHKKRDVLQGGSLIPLEPSQPHVDPRRVGQLLEHDVVGSKLHAEVTFREVFEVVVNGGLRSEEVPMLLLPILPVDGLIGVDEGGVGAPMSLFVLTSEIIVPLFLVVEEEINSAHFSGDAGVFGVGVELDHIGEALLDFRIAAGDLEHGVVLVRIDCDQAVEGGVAVVLLHGRLDDLPSQLAGDRLALDLELHRGHCHLAQRAQLGVGVENTSGLVGSGIQGDGDGVASDGLFGLLVDLPTVGLEVEDETLILLDTVDVVVGGGLVIAEEVVGLHDRLPLVLGLRLLGQLLLVAPCEGRDKQKQGKQQQGKDMPHGTPECLYYYTYRVTSDTDDIYAFREIDAQNTIRSNNPFRPGY